MVLSWLFVVVSWFEYAIIVWLVSLMDFVKEIQNNTEKKTLDYMKYALLIVLVVLHFGSGVYYIYHLITAEGV